jgi:5-methylcytosine-specific restriction endonuclease McrA
LLSQHVLVLNQNYEPVNVCSVRRAIILVFRGKAQIVEQAGSEVRSVATRFPVPSVVRLVLYIRVPQKRMVLSKRNVVKRDGHQCQYCGATHAKMTVDHVIPRTLGGGDTWENLVCACARCNNIKGFRSPEQAGLKLIRRPRRPNQVTFIRLMAGGVPDHRWKPYLFMD